MASPDEQRRNRAVVLSGLVFPGAGQLHLGSRARGALLIASSLALIGLLCLRLLQMVIDAVTAPPVASLGAVWGRVFELLERHRAALAPVGLALLAVWLLGIADAWLSGGVATARGSGDTERRPSRPVGGPR